MLLIEIILTIFAWRKGWRWAALLPTAIALLVGLFMGFGIGASGGDINGAMGMGIILDILAVIALIIMIVVGPKSNNKIEETKIDNEQK